VNQSKNVRWSPVLDEAERIVDQYETSITLRQLFYRLVVARLLPNTQNYYRTLSSRTAEARRDGTFPDLLDQRGFHRQARAFSGVDDALRYAHDVFRLDRTAGQDNQIWIAGEKATLLGQLEDWFFEFGVNIVVGGGYYSQTSCDQIARVVDKDGREPVLIYGGDHDPSGHDILRDLVARTGCFDLDSVIRVAVGPNEVEHFGLPENPGKEADSRAATFRAEFGRLVQVEIEALDPNDLHDLYIDAFDQFWDQSKFEEVLAEERGEAAKILPAADRDALAYLSEHHPDLADRVLDREISVLSAQAFARQRTSEPRRRLRRRGTSTP
jgi:hypothetical protein